jgi:hypothetical protein
MRNRFSLFNVFPDDVLTDRVFSYLSDAELVQVLHTSKSMLHNSELQIELKKRIDAQSLVSDVVANNENIFIILKSGRVLAAGINALGELGLGHEQNQKQFAAVQHGLEQQTIRQIYTANQKTFFVNQRNQLFGSGRHSYGLHTVLQTMISRFLLTNLNTKKIQQFHIDCFRGFILTSDHQLLKFGPIEDPNYNYESMQLLFKKIVKFTATLDNLYLINEQGKAAVYDVYAETLSPLEGDMSAEIIIDVQASLTNSPAALFLAESGAVYYQGGVRALGLLEPAVEPTLITTLSAVTVKKCWMVSSLSASFSCFFLNDQGQVYACGGNRKKQLGLDNAATYVQEPVLIAGALENLKIVDLKLTPSASFFLTDEGSVFACGDNRQGRLGLGVANEVHLPTQVLGGLSNQKIVSVYCHEDAPEFLSVTLFQSADGNLFGCGSNELLQLDHAESFILEPVLLTLNLALAQLPATKSFLALQKNSKTVETLNAFILLPTNPRIPL